MENQFSFDQQPDFNIKVLLLKLLSNWKWFLLTLALTLFVAYYINVRKENIYELDTYVTVKDERNPFMTSNMSLVFNWGGVSDKVSLIKTTFQSRTHNEKVVEDLKSYIDYLKKGKYYYIDVYKQAPFVFEIDKSKKQLINVPIEVIGVDDTHFSLKVKPEDENVSLYDYVSGKTSAYKLSNFQQDFTYGQAIDLPFLKGVIKKNNDATAQKNAHYFLKLSNFNSVVSKFRDGLQIKAKDKNSSILILKLRGTNKSKLQDYLNYTANLLKQQILNDKNKYAVNTIKFIDSTLTTIKNDLRVASEDLKGYISNKTVLNLDDPTAKLYEKITGFDLQKNTIIQKKMYYDQLQNYLVNKQNYEDLPAPTVVGIEDPTIVKNISRITELAIKKKQLLANYQEDFPAIQNINLEIETLRKTLLQTVKSATYSLNQEQNLVNRNIQRLEKQINKLPEEKQILLTLRRKQELKQEVYNGLLQKRNEASIVKASNVSDLKIIDSAKDVGQIPVAPNRKINYIIALALGLMLPALIIFVLFLLDNKVYNISDLEELTDVPVLGHVHHNKNKGKLPVVENTHDVVAESFRSLRSTLRFMYPKHEGAQRILITSSISGEGKTFVSSNLALVQASSKLKTVLLGFDMRKPRFKDYFKEAESTNPGLSDYLSGNASIDEMIMHTEYDNLDLVLSGAIPPNPSELLLTDATQKLFDKLGERYDQIIIDSPPIGLVSDALELQKFADVTVFVVREDYSLKSFIKDIDERYKKGEMKNIAIIYNDFKVNAIKQYGYGQKYGYGYGYGGYFEEKKKKKWWQKIFKK